MGGQEKYLKVLHLNIRQSISILLFKIIALDIIAASLIAFFFLLFTQFNSTNPFIEKFFSFNTIFFVFLGVWKISFTAFVILQWLNEYYEVYTDHIEYKKGIIYRKIEKRELMRVETVKLYQDLLGRLLNYGTISLFDRRRNRIMDLYLIHNVNRFFPIIEALTNQADEEKYLFREHVFDVEKLPVPSNFRWSPRPKSLIFRSKLQ